MRVDWWSLTDQALLKQCDIDNYRASGPGGQHRNRTDSAVRLRHKPTNVVVTAEERRSQHENKAQAFKRLREAIAFQHRQPIEETAPEFIASIRSLGKIDLKPKNPLYLPTAGYALDLLAHHLGRTSEAAAALGISTANLVKFFRSNDDMWQIAQRIRQVNNLPLLR